MVALLLYCYATGTCASRKVLCPCRTEIAGRIIGGDDIPNVHTISDFCKTLLIQLEAGGSLPRCPRVERLGRVGQGGDHCSGRDQGPGQRLAAQGDELRADAGRREGAQGECHPTAGRG